LRGLIDRQLEQHGDSPLKVLGPQLESLTRYGESLDPESDDYSGALTLLPSVVALLQPWLPIIVFSSTGQRRTLALLDRFANIVTRFQKPRLPFSGEEAVPEAWYGLNQALRSAERIRRANKFRRELSPAPRPVTTGAKLPHAEVYIDESQQVSDPQFHL